VLNVSPWDPTKEGNQSNLRAANRLEPRRGCLLIGLSSLRTSSESWGRRPMAWNLCRDRGTSGAMDRVSSNRSLEGPRSISHPWSVVMLHACCSEDTCMDSSRCTSLDASYLSEHHRPSCGRFSTGTRG
jgi:hypothetical protein